MTNTQFPQSLNTAMRWVSQDLVLARLRVIAIALALIWAALNLAKVPWLFVGTDIEVPPPTVVVDVVDTSSVTIDIGTLQGWHLFGEANGSAEPALVVAPALGIEDGAKETRLDLVLVGVLAARSDGLGQAIIQYRQDQSIYRVADALPVSGRVSLAKVLPDRVVLDNNGTYELLKLYDESALATRLMSSAAPSAAKPASQRGSQMPAAVANPESIREEVQAERQARLDAKQRDRYYDNPESLSELVSVSAVRSADGQLAGYRVSPGPKGEEFQALGFRPGDVVTEVNGLSLSDPSNALVLYQMLKSASEANFVIQRGGSPMNLTVQVGGNRP